MNISFTWWSAGMIQFRWGGGRARRIFTGRRGGDEAQEIPRLHLIKEKFFDSDMLIRECPRCADPRREICQLFQFVRDETGKYGISHERGTTGMPGIRSRREKFVRSYFVCAAIRLASGSSRAFTTRHAERAPVRELADHPLERSTRRSDEIARFIGNANLRGLCVDN